MFFAFVGWFIIDKQENLNQYSLGSGRQLGHNLEWHPGITDCSMESTEKWRNKKYNALMSFRNYYFFFKCESPFSSNTTSHRYSTFILQSIIIHLKAETQSDHPNFMLFYLFMVSTSTHVYIIQPIIHYLLEQFGALWIKFKPSGDVSWSE